MPRPNRQRAVYAEDHLAQRIANERTERGWTIDGLAKRMTDAGCNMTGSAIFKIEKGEPRRRIVVDELVAFSQVLGIPVDELLMPPETARKAEVLQLVAAWHTATVQHRQTLHDVNESREALRRYMEAHPDAGDDLVGVLTEWADDTFDEGDREYEIAFEYWNLTGNEMWRRRFQELFDQKTAEMNVARDGE